VLVIHKGFLLRGHRATSFLKTANSPSVLTHR
jgi:hypothetical protein